ncbi:MAG: D-glycero-beta-D-manno-heptose-7-phosphate kinase [Alphaproteobacteria bacterium]|nr:D-glycero-beta-D-manno-heptose-7-phosphate kinase [Alphaproteobacteria bacterium]
MPIDDHDLPAAIAALKRASVLVVGDAMLDRYVYGHVARISPEAPIPVLAVDREIAMPGGAGNVVRNLTALGAAAAFVSLVGDDEAGQTLTALIGTQPGVEPWLLVEAGRVTTVKTRFVAGAQQLLRADRETLARPEPRTTEKLIRIAAEAVAACAVMVISDYAKGLLAGETPQRLIAAAKAAGRKVVVDPKGADYGRYRGADLLTPNRRELSEATGMPTRSDSEVVAAARKLIARAGVEAVLCTRSEDGMTLLAGKDGGIVRHFPAEAREVFDVSGAGDTVVAVLAAALGAGLALPVAARLANIAAGIVVGKIGTAVAREKELLAAVAPDHGSGGKVATLEHAIELVERWRRQGLRVGFTNGCFDLLHPGHIHLLEQSRAACDRLVVGLNSDASVARLKGPTRPVQPEAARAQVLASLGAVDLVVPFEEDTPLALISALRPDLLVKGADYTREKVVGGDLVESWGGKVMLARLLPGHSTTATVTRLKR